MPDFSKITVVSITGLQSVAPGAALSIMHSVQALPGSHGLLISPERPEGMPGWIGHVGIKPFGYLEYSLFVLYALGEFIKTEFALIVQDDGWVLNADKWQDAFFNYDYLGAPVHLARITQGTDAFYKRGFEWLNYRDRECRIENIYNGGFSLRSKRLLDAPRRFGLEFTIPVPGVCPGPPYALDWEGEVVLEDVWLCLTVRQKLEAEGFIFPELDIARHFSIEHAAPFLHSPEFLPHIFGHHSKFRKIRSLNPKEIAYGLSEQQVAGTYGENWIVDFLERSGYSIKWHNMPA